MRKRIGFLNTINARILLVLIVLFIVITGIVGTVNNRNIRNLYESSYTERLLLTNALMGSTINSEDIQYFIDLLDEQDNEFRQRQVDFFHDREELFRLQEEGASDEEQAKVMKRLAAFHEEMNELKNDKYWDILDELKELKKLSKSTYVYVMADMGLKTEDGESLYTYIFDAEDQGEYSTPDMDGLGTSDIGNEAFTNVFLTKKQTEQAELYEGDFGNLYFVCVPLLNDDGDVVAILGTDLAIDDMNEAIKASISLFNNIMVSIFIVSVILIFFLLSRSIANPISSLTETALAFAEGNLHTSISKSALKQRTEIGTLARAFESTLAATTLYLNSVPESIFIMNSNQETYFRNEQFIKNFSNMTAEEFMHLLFPHNAQKEMEERLKRENNTTIVWISGYCYAVMLKEIVLPDVQENSILVIANDITDLMKEKENAQAAADAKSSFLSRMSHEMRTPMNAIIGMTKVAGSSDSMSSIKHCISIINASSEQLLSIINDVLDMSKIEAGKLELENAPVNIEKTIMKVSNLVIESIDKKKQKFNIELGENLKLHYMTDDLRLSQVLTNLLSNAVKFTPEGGTINLLVENVGQEDNMATLRFSVSDNGIGMTEEQIDKLFNAFEQADGSIARKFGGTGLGLTISQNIVKKMGGYIDVKSVLGEGTKFIFDVVLEVIPQQEAVIFDGISPEDIRVLIIENDEDIRKRFVNIVKNFGIYVDVAADAEEALDLLDEANKINTGYDVIFLSYEISDTDGIDMINRCSSRIDRNSVIIITTYSEWHQIEKYALENNINRYITKPIFPSSVLDSINDVVGEKLKELDIKTKSTNETPDLSGVKILLAEDIEINREIFLALIEGTNISTDIAENGLEAVSKFKENPDLYDMIIMDIQMPEMDGYEATKTIRAMDDIPRAASIPIVAMSANAFQEDIERSLASGMNDHLAKPIDLNTVIEKIRKYTNR